MPGFAAALRGDQPRLDAIRRLIDILNTQGAGIPARFVQAAENINAERRLPKACWKEIADVAHSLIPTMMPPYNVRQFSALENALLPIFRRHQLKGPKRKADRKILGRLMPRKVFESIVAAHGVPPPMVAAAVDDLISGATVAADYLKNIPLGKYLVWSTYCEQMDYPDPFRPREPDHIKFVDSLGLYPDRGDFFLGFKYRSPTPDKVLFPTIADAYGGLFFYGFRPGGRTRPVHYAELAGRPEAVHCVLKGESLVGAPEEFGPL